MAPGGTPPTGPRRSTQKTRGPSRGGIQKRGAAQGRVDKDGDLIMDGAKDVRPSGRGRPEGSSRGRSNRRGGAGTASSRSSLSSTQTQQALLKGLQTQHANIVESKPKRREEVQIVVRGLKDSKAAKNKDGGLKDLLGFLERKGSAMDGAPRRGLRIKKSRIEGDDTVITIAKEEGEILLKLNGFKFAGADLIVERAEGNLKDEQKLSDAAKDAREQFRSILSKRYNVELKLLDLSALGQDPDLLAMGMFAAENRIEKLFKVLMKVCEEIFTTPQQKRDAIVSVTLADNALSDIKHVTLLAQTFPDILNLDLSRNKFSDIRQLDGWRHRFRKLQNIRILENPIDSTSADYKQELLKWYTNLQVLNDVQVRTPEEIEMHRAKNEAVNVSPIPIQPPDFRDVGGIGLGFVMAFFPLYDSDRANLANTLYDVHSTVSVSVNTSAPRASDQTDAVHKWTSYITHSRNLNKVISETGRLSKLCRGVEEIKALWNSLPATNHPDIATQTDKWLVDCHPQSGLPDITGQNPRGVDGLALTVQGQFEERSGSDVTTRSFSRVFILGPGSGQPGAPTIRVVSDIMVVRAWSPLATAATEEGSGVAGGAPNEAVQKQVILTQLVQRTQMTPEYATMCLTETAWDLEKAMVAFETNKSKLPSDAFINPAAAAHS